MPWSVNIGQESFVHIVTFQQAYQSEIEMFFADGRQKGNQRLIVILCYLKKSISIEKILNQLLCYSSIIVENVAR